MKARPRLLWLVGALVSPGLLAAQSSVLRSQGPACEDVSSEALPTKITIVGVEFRGENPLSEEELAQLTEKIKQGGLTASANGDDKEWVREVEEVPVRGALQNRGYFRVLAEVTPYLVRAEAHERFYALEVRVDSGPQYRLGEIQIVNAESPTRELAFRASELRKEIPPRDGELFDVSKVREGLESLGRIYGSKGHVDMTVEPSEKIDETEHRIDLILKVSEEKQYRVRTVGVRALPPSLEAEARSVLEIGEPLSVRALNAFFERNKSVLPVDASRNNVLVQRDTASGTVDIVLDFWRDPSEEPSCQ